MARRVKKRGERGILHCGRPDSGNDVRAWGLPTLEQEQPPGYWDGTNTTSAWSSIRSVMVFVGRALGLALVSTEVVPWIVAIRLEAR